MISRHRLISTLKQTGFDKAIGFTVVGKIIQTVVQLGSIFLIGHRLNPDQQGYYYTFQSILALQVFFELGMSNVLVQVVSHERASICPSQEIDDGNQQTARIGSLLRFLIRWYAITGTAFIAISFPIGVWFFQQHKENLSVGVWLYPWLLAVSFSACSMIFQAATAFLEGLGKISQAASLRALFSIVAAIGVFLSLLFGLGLFSPGIALLLGFGIAFSTLLHRYRKLFYKIWQAGNNAQKISWLKEIWGFQWRIALSWASGYLIFQFTTPVLFSELGPTEAGKYGMTQQVVNGISMLSMAWATTKQAKWGSWIAQKNFLELDRDFKITTIQTTTVNIALALFAFASIEATKIFHLSISSRFAEPKVLILLLAAGSLNQIVFTQATYLRAHKKEPLLLLSIIGGIIVGSGTLLLASEGSAAVAWVQFFSTLSLGLGAGTIVFEKKKREWHE